MDVNAKHPTVSIRRRTVIGLIILAVILSVLTMVAGCGRQPRETMGPEPAPGALGPEEPGKPGEPGQAEEPSTPEPEMLDGMVFVSIGNNASARPQSGLSKAAVVFEVPAEGGITRLMAGSTLS